MHAKATPLSPSRHASVVWGFNARKYKNASPATAEWLWPFPGHPKRERRKKSHLTPLGLGPGFAKKKSARPDSDLLVRIPPPPNVQCCQKGSVPGAAKKKSERAARPGPMPDATLLWGAGGAATCRRLLSGGLFFRKPRNQLMLCFR